MHKGRKLIDKGFDKKLGENFRAVRLQANYTTEEIAKAIGASFQQVQKYESGTNRFPLGRLAVALRYLGCPVEMFLECIGVVKAEKEGAHAFILIAQEEYKKCMSLAYDVLDISNRAREIIKSEKVAPT